jgi:Tfp pilus assembly protein PilF
LDSAKSHFESAMAIFEQHYGPEHPKVATLLNNLGYVHLKAGDVQSAHDLFHRALAIARTTLGESHPTIAAILHNLGMSHLRAGQKLLATEALERALAIDVAAYGENHPDVLRDCNALIALANQLGDAVMAGDFTARSERIRASLSKQPEPAVVEP